MSNIVPRPNMAMTRASSREVRVLQRQGEVALTHVNVEAVVRESLIRNGFTMAYDVVQRMAILNRVITELTHDNPALEMTLRVIEQSVGIEAAQVIGDYMRR